MDIPEFVRGHAMLVASGLLALISFIIVPPSWELVDSIDVATLCILFCFMAVVAGIASCGTFSVLSDHVLHGGMTARRLCLLLVMLPTFCSMAITNDVALITFVPFSIIVLTKAGRMDLMIPVIVLQTVGANLGSMMTPFGNPQNLFIFSHYSPGIGEFIMTVLPLVIIGLVMLTILCLHHDGRVEVYERRHGIENRPVMVVMLILFALCIASVLGWLPYPYLLAIIVIAMISLRPIALRMVDYGLLLTFVFLFVFTGNLTHIGFIDDVLGDIMAWDPLMSSALLSQVTSNVPAAVMLSNYTTDWQALLAGVNIGGFGTPIASMASVISFSLYSKVEGVDTGRYLMVFIAMNALFLVVLLGVGPVLL